MTTVLKLGGSVVTEKDRRETVDETTLERVAETVVEIDGPLVVIHGGGSFGHPNAADYGVSETVGTHESEGVRAIHDAMKRLNGAVVDALAAAGAPAVPIHPLSAGYRSAGGDLRLAIDPVETLLDEGFSPVIHGDVIAHEEEGATIVSGDELVVTLADALEADRVGVCSGVSGVYGPDGEVFDRIESFDAVAEAVGDSEATDVTGGMAGKVRALLSLEAAAYVFGPEDLPAFAAGGSPGTRIG